MVPTGVELLCLWVIGMMVAVTVVVLRNAANHDGDFQDGDFFISIAWPIVVCSLITQLITACAQGLWSLCCRMGRSVRSQFAPKPTARRTRLSLTRGACRVCGDGLAGRPVRVCERCNTPHHVDCWEYNGRCSVYGCRSAQTAEVVAAGFFPDGYWTWGRIIPLATMAVATGIAVTALTSGRAPVGPLFPNEAMFSRQDLEWQRRQLTPAQAKAYAEMRAECERLDRAQEAERNRRTTAWLEKNRKCVEKETAAAVGSSVNYKCGDAYQLKTREQVLAEIAEQYPAPPYVSADRYLEQLAADYAEREASLNEAMTAKAWLDARHGFRRMVDEMK